ncbi:hypothetical protein D3C76_845690 [compost metagenome]
MAVRLPLLAHDQFQYAVAGDRGDGVFAAADRYQRIDQGLGMQPHQMITPSRQLTTGQRLAQRLAKAVQLYLAVGIQAKAGEEGVDTLLSIARLDFHQVTGLPAGRCFGTQADQVDGLSLAARVEQVTLYQRPVAEARWLPGTDRLGASQLCQLLLPLLQRDLIGVVHLHRAERSAGTALPEPGLQASGEAAEVRILAVAQGEHGVAEVVQRPGLAEHLAFEATSAVGGFAVAEGADHEQRAAGLAQVFFAQFRQGTNLYRQTSGL